MPIDMKALARVGAEARIRELLSEVDDIRRAFPGIDTPRRGRPRGAKPQGASEQPAMRRRQRKPMSAAQRKAVSERMRKYWAGRRKAQGK